MILNQTDARFIAPSAADLNMARTRFQARIHTADDAVLVALPQDDSVAGYICGLLLDGVGVVDDIALDAHTYHAGMGRALWEALRVWFDARDVNGIRARVARYSAVEQAFWRSLGAHPLDDQQTTENDDLWQLPPELIWLAL